MSMWAMVAVGQNFPFFPAFNTLQIRQLVWASALNLPISCFWRAWFFVTKLCFFHFRTRFIPG